jgi:tellurite resistance protein
MSDRYSSANAAATQVTADREVLQALATAGALVALADGHLEDVERDELVSFVHRQDFAPTISQHRIAKAFDSRVRQLEGNYSPNVIMEALGPLAGLSLASVVVRTAERVAAADRKIHPGELQALKLIRLIMTASPVKKATRQ